MEEKKDKLSSWGLLLKGTNKNCNYSTNKEQSTELILGKNLVFLVFDVKINLH